MKWKLDWTADRLKQWKGNLLLVILFGLLLLVIVTPVKKSEPSQRGQLVESTLWGKESLGEQAGMIGEESQRNRLWGQEFVRQTSEQYEGADVRQMQIGQTQMGQTQMGQEQIGQTQMGQAQTAQDVSCEEVLERRLGKTLACMEGVGTVKVMVMLQDTGELVVEKDIPSEESQVQERDSEGGSRMTKSHSSQEKTVYGIDASGRQLPYVVQQKKPKLAGVVVVAEGGDDPKTVRNIRAVVEALFELEPHKIKVVKMTSLER